MNHFLTLVAVLVLVACRPTGDRPQPAADTSSSGLAHRTVVRPGTAAGESVSFPAVGVAVPDSALWCAEFPDSGASAALAPGQRVTIVFVKPTKFASWGAHVRQRRSLPCPTAFGQPRWDGYASYDLALIGSLRLDGDRMPTATLVVASAATWVRGADDLVRADLDGDGIQEEARRCTADEGEHFTIWSVFGATRRVRRAHEYFDWGAFTNPTCRPGEAGETEG